MAAILCVWLSMAWCTAGAVDSARRVRFDIAPQELGPALIEFSHQAGVQVVSDAVDISHTRSQGVSGLMSIRDGLTRLLSGTGFSFVAVGRGTYAIRLASTNAARPDVAEHDPLRARRATVKPQTAQTLAEQSPNTAGTHVVPTSGQQTHAARLSTVVVVGSRTPESISQIPASVYYVGSQEIQARVRGGASLAQILGTLVPSMDVGYQTRTNAFQNLQGREAQVMINGVSLMSIRDIHRQFDSINPFNIDHIVVMSGASSLYGAGATGGIINIVTKKGRPGPLRVTLQAGAATKGKSQIDSRQLAVSLQGGNQRVTGRLSFAWHKTDGFYGPHGKQIFYDISQTGLQYNVTKGIMGSVKFHLRNGGTLQLLGQYYRSHRHGGKGLYLGPGLAGLLGHPQLLEMRSGLSLGNWKPGTQRKLFTLGWNAPGLVFGQNLLVQAYYRTADLNYYPFPVLPSIRTNLPPPRAQVTLPFYGASSQDTTVKGLRTALVAQLGSHAKLTYGVDYSREQFHATETLFDTTLAFASGGMTFNKVDEIGKYPDFEGNQLALYAQLDWKLDPDLRLTAGVRGERINIDVSDFVGYYQQGIISRYPAYAQSAEVIPGGSNSYTAVLPNVGLVWSLPDDRQIYANYSVGFNIPDPAKYYGQGDYQLIFPARRFVLGDSTNPDNAALQAIKTRQLQLGFRGYTQRLDYNVAVFYSKSDKTFKIVPVVLNVVELDRPVRVFGVQGKLTYWVAPAWQLGASGIWVQTDQKVGGEWVDGRVTSSSPAKLVTFVAYAPAGTEGPSLRLQSTTVFDLDGVDASNPDAWQRHTLHGYTTVGLFGAWDFGSWQLNAGVKNLLDNYYQTLWSQRQQIFSGAVLAPAVYFQGMGRRYAVTLSMNF